MIHTSRQLKDLVRNRSNRDSNKAQVIIRSYVMERFLERLSLSPYRNNLILKGGVLVSSMIGLDNRSTMDVDATVKNLPLSVENAKEILGKITSVPLDDGITFEMRSVVTIMDEDDYAGVRVTLDARIDTMHTPLKIDFSTGDVITHKEIEYSFKLMFEERSVSILAYNLETVLAEKLETVIARGTANTRMRDFYDIYAFETGQPQNISPTVLGAAYANTCKKRGLRTSTDDAQMILDEVEDSPELAALWDNYRSKFDYAAGISWREVMKSVRKLYGITVPRQ